jgi:hypothetical protein
MPQPQPHVAVRVLLALAASNSWLAMGGPWVHHGAKTLCAASIHPSMHVGFDNSTAGWIVDRPLQVGIWAGREKEDTLGYESFYVCSKWPAAMLACCQRINPQLIIRANRGDRLVLLNCIASKSETLVSFCCGPCHSTQVFAAWDPPIQ